jgi:3-deoxy-alpha-D-manno-octulosonate 8-oxidase
MKIIKQVPRIVFGKSSFLELDAIASPYRDGGYCVFLLDKIHTETGLKDRVNAHGNDVIIDIDTTDEPTTDQVDGLREQIWQERKNILPSLLIGIGGGSVLDITKALSVILTNEGSSSKYQGWDLVLNKSLPKMGIPTLSGTGSEASRTAVLLSKDKKFGINSDESMFDWLLLDPELTATVPNDQRFYTGMDCYIHCVESLDGSFINSFGTVYAKSALELCKKYFLKQGGSDEDLMVASYMGGASVANSEVGVAHALSYGLSLVLKFHHGVANCIAFNQLDEFYPDYLPEFKKMVKLNGVYIPSGVTKGMSADNIKKMVDMTLKMERPLTSALGGNWKNILTEDKIRALYKKM